MSARSITDKHARNLRTFFHDFRSEEKYFYAFGLSMVERKSFMISQHCADLRRTDYNTRMSAEV